MIDEERFVRDGYARLDGAVPRPLADACRAILWRASGCDPEDPSTWTKPVVRLGQLQGPFADAANTPALHEAYDALVGRGRWLRPGGLGTFPLRFPSTTDPGDCGWHVDVSFGTDDPDFLQWRANVASRGRALLALFLFTDVDDDDAPTLLRAGSHLDVARRLAPAGDDGLTLGALAADGFDFCASRPEVAATGAAGTVYLCHPFVVHRAQPHPRRPRFIAQPPLLPAEPLRVDGPSPVERAIRVALA